MIVVRRPQILGTSGASGFIRGRKYDTDLNRLGRMKTAQRELQKTGDIGKEVRNMSKELNNYGSIYN